MNIHWLINRSNRSADFSRDIGRREKNLVDLEHLEAILSCNQDITINEQRLAFKSMVFSEYTHLTPFSPSSRNPHCRLWVSRHSVTVKARLKKSFT
jgi:hypothetical protein